MRRLIYLLTSFLILVFMSCAATVPLTEQEKTYQKIIEFDLSKDELFTRSLDWATSNFTGSHQLVFQTTLLDKGETLQTGVQNKDKESGSIQSNGFFCLAELTIKVLKVENSVVHCPRTLRKRLSGEDKALTFLQPTVLMLKGTVD